MLDLIYHEVLIREEFGEKPALEDFAARFPQHVERLQRLFAVHGAIEDDGWDEELDSAFADDAAPKMRDESDAQNAPSSTDVGDSADRKKSHWPRKPRESRPVEPPPSYELLEEIGRGGMAVVFRAKQQILNRIVALKMLLAGGVASKEVLARIQQEAQAVAQLQHPGIVQIHEVGVHRGRPFLSLEYIAGGTLHEWLDGHPLPPLEAARIIEQLARTTQYAHERGVVHRDLKPANVLLTERPSSLQSSATIPVGQPTPQHVNTLARAGDSDASHPRCGECVALRQLGRHVETVERYERSISLSRAVLKALPTHFAASSELGMALHDYSLLLRSLGRLNDSKTAFQESFELRLKSYQLSPKSTYARTFLSRMHVSQGYFDRIEKKHESSIEQFQKAIDLLLPSVDEYPDLYEHQKDLLVAMAEHLTSCRDTRNAEIGKPAWQRFSNRLQVALQKFPKDKSVVDLAANWQYNWADHLWEDNLRPQAVTLLKSALPASTLALTLTPSLAPQDEARLSNNAAWHLAIAPDPSLRATKKSVELARRAAELAPNSSYNIHTLGTALYYDGDFAAAREQLLKAIQLEQAASKRGTLDELLEALKTLPKDSAAARKELDDSLGLKKSSPHAMSLYYSMLAMTLWKLDDHAAARDILRLIVEFRPSSPKTAPKLAV